TGAGGNGQSLRCTGAPHHPADAPGAVRLPPPHRQRHRATGELAVCLTLVVREREGVRPSDPREVCVARDLVDDAMERQDFYARAVGGPPESPDIVRRSTPRA